MTGRSPDSNRTVIVTDQIFGDVEREREALAEIGYGLEEAPNADEQTLTELAGRASGLLVCYAKVTEPVINAAARGGCKIIARYGIGVDNVDVDAASRAGVLVTYVPDHCLDEVADHTMALMLGATRNLLPAILDVRAGGWTIPREGIHRLRGKQLALIGTGRIGRQVAKRAQAFGFEVVGYDPGIEHWHDLPITPVDSLEQAVAEADVVSLHAPLTADTRHMIDARAIGLMRRAPLVINTARGALIDLDAATRALDAGQLSGLALDVTEPEPLPADHPLRTHPRALITPHMSFYSSHALSELRHRAADEVVRALTGQPPRCAVNADALEAAWKQ